MNSKIILAKNINIDRSYTNVLSYSESDMLSLINNSSNKIAESNTFSFIKHDKSIYVDFTYSQCLEATYIAFQNPDYSNKWFFAFVDDIEYKGNRNTEIFFTVDAWTTWFNNLTVKQCFVERHHVNDDTIGKNTIPENLDTGVPIQLDAQSEAGLSQYHWIAVLSSWNPATKKQFEGITIYNNITYGKEIHLFQATNMTQLTNLLLYLEDTNLDTHIADISDMFVVPYSIVDSQDLTLQTGTFSGNDYSFYVLPFSDSAKIITNTVTKPYTFTDYQPKNNKALCYPYNYLLVSNNVGNHNIYRYEDFSTTNATFDIELAISIGCSGRLIPKSYRNMSRDVDESIPLAKYPVCRLEC